MNDKNDKNEKITKFGFTEKELLDYRNLMQIPDNDENGEYDEEIDVRITALKRLRWKRIMEQQVKKDNDGK